MRNLITLTALSALSLLTVSQAQSVRSVTPLRPGTATVQQTPTRVVLAGEGRITLTALEPATPEPSNQVVHPETSGTNCRWFSIGTPALNSHWSITTTYSSWTIDGAHWVLHCWDGHRMGMAQPVKAQLQIQNFIELH
ncbi:hypothetical protein [Deinococcus alpinitundrae]|uniref:hypothetical protein n=1 Tax=Deinococcus alpinitundrae TaxID=468913 RepID=UPI001379ED7E|nr:hypothetical protein [Deinococcus alpinitundrae]